jgi:hypothetical protein
MESRFIHEAREFAQIRRFQKPADGEQDPDLQDAAPDKKWVEVSDAGEAAFRNQHGGTKP